MDMEIIDLARYLLERLVRPVAGGCLFMGRAWQSGILCDVSFLIAGETDDLPENACFRVSI
jgi:hypothetical protein